eukprot:3878350-Pyramimonas_sp.AAC.1
MGRAHRATLTVSMRPDPQCFLKARAPRWSTHRTRGSVVGNLFARADKALVGLNDGPLEIPSLKIGGRPGALVSAGANNYAAVAPRTLRSERQRR